MKKLLADFLEIGEEDIESYKFSDTHDLSLGQERGFYNIITVIEGTIKEPAYEVITKLKDRYNYVSLSELLVFIYTK